MTKKEWVRRMNNAIVCVDYYYKAILSNHRGEGDWSQERHERNIRHCEHELGIRLERMRKLMEDLYA